MSWLRVEGRMPQHHKVAPLSDAAFRLHVTAMAWCVEGQTDGRLPLRVPATLTRAPSGKRLEAAIKELVDAAIWISRSDGYEIHDFLQWNLSAADIAARSEAKSRAGSTGGRKSGEARSKQPRSKTEAPASGSFESAPPVLQFAAKTSEPNAKQNPSPSPIPSPIPIPEKEDPPAPTTMQAIPGVRSGSGDRCLTAMVSGPPSKRPDVLRVFEAWKGSFGRPRNVAFRGGYDEDAVTIAAAIDSHTVEDCLMVAQYAPEDDMVSGRADERKQKHESVKYIFGSGEHFSKILKLAHQREGERQAETATDRIARLKKQSGGLGS